MKDATHTPGPWEAIIGGGGCSVIVNSTVQRPILVQIATDALYAHPERVTEAQANARLIAAAPALLAALKQCLPYVDRIRGMTGGDGDLTAQNARAAIAAAKGGAQ